LSSERLIRAVDEYYTAKLRAHGPTPAGVDWNGADSQALRFRQLLSLIRADDEPLTIVDYGCGYGALVEALRARQRTFAYQGFDLSHAMVEEAAARYRDEPRAAFTADRDLLRPADFTVASGVFNVKLATPVEQWNAYVIETLDDMVRLSTRGLAFNALTVHSDEDRKRDDLFYADPAKVLDHCLREYSRDVSVRHDYALYEFTVLVRLDGRPPVKATEEGR
jgi:predicted TPR repeat methyltransferase